MVFGSINLSIHVADNRTKGTFETRLEAMTEKILKWTIWLDAVFPKYGSTALCARVKNQPY